MNKLLTQENQDILVKRAKSLGWRTVMMVIGVGLSFIIENLTLLSIPAEAKVLLGLLAGELSKEVNRRLSA